MLAMRLKLGIPIAPTRLQKIRTATITCYDGVSRAHQLIVKDARSAGRGLGNPDNMLHITTSSHGVVDRSVIYIQGRHEASGSLTEDQIQGNAGTGNEVGPSMVSKKDTRSGMAEDNSCMGRCLILQRIVAGCLVTRALRSASPALDVKPCHIVNIYISVQLLAIDLSFYYCSYSIQLIYY